MNTKVRMFMEVSSDLFQTHLLGNSILLSHDFDLPNRYKTFPILYRDSVEGLKNFTTEGFTMS